jgi:hypothetical protein
MSVLTWRELLMMTFYALLVMVCAWDYERKQKGRK